MFVEVTGKKLVGGLFAPPPPHPEVGCLVYISYSDQYQL